MFFLQAVLIFHIFQQFCSCTSLGSETENLITCSKYDFEEKVLEKLVRIEHKMEIHDEKLKHWEDTMRKKMDILDKVEQQRKNFLRSLENNVFNEMTKLNDTMVEKQILLDKIKNKTQMLTDSFQNHVSKEMSKLDHTYKEVVDNLKAEKQIILGETKIKTQMLTDSLQDHVSKEMSKLDHTYKDLVDNFNSSSEQIMTKWLQKQNITDKVAVTTCANYGTVPANKPILFPSTVTSYGITNLSIFKTTGIFTCEIEGLYIISLTVMSRTRDAFFHIYKNSQRLIEIYTQSQFSGSHWYTGTAMVVIDLEINDKITVKPYWDSYVFGYSSRQSTCLTIVKIK